MRIRRSPLFWLLLTLVALVLAPPLAAQSARAGGDIAVVVNPETPVHGLSLAEVRQIFRGDKQYWSSSMPVVLLIRAPVAREREVVLRTIFQMSEAQFKQYWVAKIFRAEATSAPKIVLSNSSAVQVVEAVPGAIAFIDARDAKPGVKVLPIDGRLPGQSGYPLR